jgi:hypothetical protein
MAGSRDTSQQATTADAAKLHVLRFAIKCPACGIQMVCDHAVRRRSLPAVQYCLKAAGAGCANNRNCNQSNKRMQVSKDYGNCSAVQLFRSGKKAQTKVYAD